MTENSKDHLLDHSEAKVKLFITYLKTYLRILLRSGSVKKIFIYDFFAGEGIYKNKKFGSAVESILAIKEIFNLDPTKIKPVEFWFNDIGKSKIEKSRKKIDRVKQEVEKILLSKSIVKNYYDEDYSKILPKAIKISEEHPMAKSLFFIDPWGYSSISLTQIDQIMKNMNNETLLFLPIAHIYRFSGTPEENENKGIKTLKILLNELFSNNIPEFSSQTDLILRLKQELKRRFKLKDIYVENFIIEKDTKTKYSLFFFTHSHEGLRTMVEAKWKMDPSAGSKYSQLNGPQLFSQEELMGYKSQILAFIDYTNGENGKCTNHDLYIFGLEKGFLPSHTKPLLDDYVTEKRILRTRPEGINSPYNYLGNENEEVFFKNNPDFGEQPTLI